MKIVIDVMGGDGGPDVVLKGIAMASKSFIKENDEFILTGNKESIEEHCKCVDIQIPYTIVGSSNDITMTDSPTDALFNKKESSIAKGLEFVKNKKADAFFSAGNTGAILAYSIKTLGRIKGILRPALGTIFPVGRHPLILDVGATVDIKAEILHQFAYMGSEYIKNARNIEKPIVGLLSVGEENSKGNKILKNTFDLIANNKDINFLGNIEGHDFFTDKVDVIVCDGFVGNVILKFAEGFIKFFKTELKEIVNTSFIAKMGMSMAYPSVKNFFKKYNYDEYGGAPLLGVNGLSIVGHGKSTSKAIESAILKTKQLIENKFIDHLQKNFEKRSINEQN